MKDTISVILVGIGIPLLLLSFLWSTFFPASSNWTDEKAVRMKELGREAHKLMFASEAAAANNDMKSGESAAELKARYKETQKELKAMREEFESQRDSPQTVATFLRWTGIGLVLVGGAASFVSKG